MSESPTYASVLTRLFSADRKNEQTQLQSCNVSREAERLAVKQTSGPVFVTRAPVRLIAAEAVFHIYRDTPAAVEAIAGVVQNSEPAIVAGGGCDPAIRPGCIAPHRPVVRRTRRLRNAVHRLPPLGGRL
ncbi:MAG: hypothetical protein U0792_07715 [Gemmataceae bacterium]